MQGLVLLLPIFAGLGGATPSGITVQETRGLKQGPDGNPCNGQSVKVIRPTKPSSKLHGKGQPGDAIILAGAAAIGKSRVGRAPDASERRAYQNVQHGGRTAVVKAWKQPGGAERPVFDLDSSEYKTNGKDDFAAYIGMIKEVRKKYPTAIIMVCTKQPFVEEMHAEGLEFSVVYPSGALKLAYEGRVDRRMAQDGISEQDRAAQRGLKQVMFKNWELWQKRWADDEVDLKFEFTTKDDYLSDCMGKIVAEVIKSRAQASSRR